MAMPHTSFRNLIFQCGRGANAGANGAVRIPRRPSSEQRVAGVLLVNDASTAKNKKFKTACRVKEPTDQDCLKSPSPQFALYRDPYSQISDICRVVTAMNHCTGFGMRSYREPVSHTREPTAQKNLSPQCN